MDIPVLIASASFASFGNIVRSLDLRFAYSSVHSINTDASCIFLRRKTAETQMVPDMPYLHEKINFSHKRKILPQFFVAER